jgi:nucleotide-binding universal stress UspA family protein
MQFFRGGFAGMKAALLRIERVDQRFAGWTSPAGCFMFRRILCPIDFTTFSHHALEYAVALARSQGASVTGVHVLSTPPSAWPSEARGEPTGDDLTHFQAQVLKILRETEAPSPTAVAVPGDPAHEIERLATALGADAIVMPIHGLTGRAAHACGAVTEHVLCHATVPVIVVPDPA